MPGSSRPTLRSPTWLTIGALLIVGVPIMLAIEFAGQSTQSEETAAPATSPTPPSPASSTPAPKEVTYASLSEITKLFDRETGEPVIWFSGSSAGTMRFFDRGGFDPLTGERLEPLTREVLVARERSFGEKASQKRKQAAQTERTRYVDTRVLARFRQEQHPIALTVRSSGEEQAGALQAAIGQALERQGLVVETGLLRSGALVSNIFDDLASGRRLAQLGLAGMSGYLIVGTAPFEEPTASNFDRLQNVRASLKLHLVSLRTGAVETVTLSEIGAGFSRAKAQERLRERIVESLLNQPQIQVLMHHH